VGAAIDGCPKIVNVSDQQPDTMHVHMRKAIHFDLQETTNLVG